MKLRFSVLALVTLLATNTASATSLLNVSEEEIRDRLAESFVASLYCKEFTLRHNVLDLVWDVLELKTGSDPEDDTEKSLYVARVDEWGAKFKADVRRSCADAYARFGPDGSAIRDALYRK